MRACVVPFMCVHVSLCLQRILHGLHSKEATGRIARAHGSGNAPHLETNAMDWDLTRGVGVGGWAQ